MLALNVYRDPSYNCAIAKPTSLYTKFLHIFFCFQLNFPSIHSKFLRIFSHSLASRVTCIPFFQELREKTEHSINISNNSKAQYRIENPLNESQYFLYKQWKLKNKWKAFALVAFWCFITFLLRFNTFLKFSIWCT